MALASAVKLYAGEFSAQNLANLAWAFATAGVRADALWERLGERLQGPRGLQHPLPNHRGEPKSGTAAHLRDAGVPGEKKPVQEVEEVRFGQPGGDHL